MLREFGSVSWLLRAAAHCAHPEPPSLGSVRRGSFSWGRGAASARLGVVAFWLAPSELTQSIRPLLWKPFS